MRIAVLFGLLLTGSAHAQDLSERLQTLEIQVRELKEPKASSSPIEILQSTNQIVSQLGPVASKIYFHPKSPYQLGLSSELFTYQDTDYPRANVLNVAPMVAFRMHPRLLFNSQFLFENGGSESRNTITYQKGQSIVLMAYLDWLASEKGDSGVRIGHQLIPIGWANTRQEPVTYLSVSKPELERVLIPSSWHENGLSFWIDRERADIQAGIFNSLDASGFRGDTFLAGGRNQGQNAKAQDFMGVIRINSKSDWFLMGMSLAAGNTSQRDPALRNGTFRLGEFHGRLRFSRLEILGQWARGEIDDAERISIRNSTNLGSRADGHSLQAAFNLLEGSKQLWAFARYSQYNLHQMVPIDVVEDPTLNKRVTTFGMSYFPLPTVVLKMDYALKENASANEGDEFSLGVGVVF